MEAYFYLFLLLKITVFSCSAMPENSFFIYFVPLYRFNLSARKFLVILSCPHVFLNCCHNDLYKIQSMMSKFHLKLSIVTPCLYNEIQTLNKRFMIPFTVFLESLCRLFSYSLYPPNANDFQI